MCNVITGGGPSCDDSAVLIIVGLLLFYALCVLIARSVAVGIAGWDLNTTRDAAVYLLPDRHTALLEPRVMDRDKRYLLLVIVCSAVQNFETRCVTLFYLLPPTLFAELLINHRSLLRFR